jgi:hypothetical protein
MNFTRVRSGKLRAWAVIVLGGAGWMMAAEPYRGPIIDVHLHTESPKQLAGTRRGLAAPGTEESRKANDIASRAHDARVALALGIDSLKQLPELNLASFRAATLAEMDRLNITRAFVSGPDYAEAAAWAEQAPERFSAGIASTDLAAIKQARAEGKLGFIGELGLQYRGIAPNDPKLEPLWAYAENEGLPVALHLHPGPPGAPYIGTALRSELGRPLQLESVLNRHPGLRLYVMHAGWPFGDDMIALLWDYPQVYVDVGVINWTLSRAAFHDYLKRLVDAGFANRIMFGSDQMGWPEALAKAVEAVDSAPFLTAEQKRAIFHDNAVRFFGLK